MEETWFQSYSKQYILQSLSKFQGGPVEICLSYKKGEQYTMGRRAESNAAPISTLTVHKATFWTRLALNMNLGFAQAYMEQEIDCDDLGPIFDLCLENMTLMSDGNPILQLLPRLYRWAFPSDNNLTSSRSNASSHYDTSNELFASFLSPDMNYSCAMWSGDPGESLESAQKRKVQNIISKAEIRPGDHVLDIGCGWGDFAIAAVRNCGCRVTGITLSAEQKKLAEARVQDAGMEDRIEILLCDYREVEPPEGGFDRIVSVEMIEHVGRQYMETFFARVSKLLKRVDGIAVTQCSTQTQKSHSASCKVESFQDLIFPGGYLPTVHNLLDQVHRGSGGSLEVDDVQNIGPDYVQTLALWRANFNKNWAHVQSDYLEANPEATQHEVEAFRRKWTYYFTYVAAGFRMRTLGVHVVRMVRTP